MKENTGLKTRFVPHFDPFGITEVSPEQWMQLKSKAEEVLVAVMELDAWVVDYFKKEEMFTICGI